MKPCWYYTYSVFCLISYKSKSRGESFFICYHSIFFPECTFFGNVFHWQISHIYVVAFIRSRKHDFVDSRLRVTKYYARFSNQGCNGFTSFRKTCLCSFYKFLETNTRFNLLTTILYQFTIHCAFGLNKH